MKKRDWLPRTSEEVKSLHEINTMLNGGDDHPMGVDKNLEHFLSNPDQYSQAEKDYVEIHCQGCARCREARERLERDEFMESFKKEAERSKEAEL